MGISSAINAARSGLNAASLGIETTSNNVANAATKGYSRRSVRTSGAASVTLGGHARGTGVEVDRIQRSTDWFIVKRSVQSAGDRNQAMARRDTLIQAESWFSDGDVGALSARVQGLYDSLSLATTDPGNSSYRQQFLTDADRFARGISRVAGAMDDIQSDLEDRGEELAISLNTRLEQVAELNVKILETGDVDSAATLIDERDQVARSLAEDLGAEIRFDYETGEAAILVGGVALVHEGEWSEVEATANAAGQLSLERVSGSLDLGDSVRGTFGGMIESWSDVESYLDDLDSVVTDLADAFNTQHNAGFDLNGAAGADLFIWDNTLPHVSTSLKLDETITSDEVAFAGAAAASPGDIDNLKSLLDLEDSLLFTAGTETSEQFMTGLISGVGFDINKAESDVEHYSAVLNDLDVLRDSVAGVDLDEEAAALIQYQTAYQAAAKVMTVADELIQTLMQVA